MNPSKPTLPALGQVQLPTVIPSPSNAHSQTTVVQFPIAAPPSSFAPARSGCAMPSLFPSLAYVHPLAFVNVAESVCSRQRAWKFVVLSPGNLNRPFV